MKYADKDLTTLIATGQDHAFSFMKPKSRIEASKIVSILDDNGRVIDVFYRVLDACPNAQTDLSEDIFTIEQVTYKGRRVNLSSRGEQILHEWLYRNIDKTAA